MAAEKLMVLQPQHSAAYILLSNIYAATGNWNERAKVRSLMDKRKVKKEAGYSWIVLKNKTHAFLVGDRSHPLSNLIYSKLQELSTRLKDMGCRPDTNCVLHDIEDELKKRMLFQHSERLAVVLGLISTPNGTPLQIEKNLRICGDCHTVFNLYEQAVVCLPCVSGQTNNGTVSLDPKLANFLALSRAMESLTSWMAMFRVVVFLFCMLLLYNLGLFLKAVATQAGNYYPLKWFKKNDVGQQANTNQQANANGGGSGAKAQTPYRTAKPRRLA
ncbi:hypothetical protein V2J09_002815 [Rumex salicifolius]